jgi:large subunit ribosomal protein L25
VAIAVKTLNAEIRSARGFGASKNLRREGRLPAVVYGHKKETQPILISRRDLDLMLAAGQRVVVLSVAGTEEQVMIKSLQYDTMGDNVIHADFIRIKAGEKVVVSVQLEILGTAKGAKTGGVLQAPTKEVTVECEPMSIPDKISFSVSELDIDGIIRAKELKLPEGVALKSDPEAVVAMVVIPVIEEAPAPAAAGEMEMPEVIGAKEEEEEGEEAEPGKEGKTKAAPAAEKPEKKEREEKK